MRIAAVLTFLFLALKVSAGIITVTGQSKGQPLFIQNPFDANTKKFCIVSIYVNHEQVAHNPRQSAVEVSMDNHPSGERIEVKIIHKKNCKPHLVNPQAIKQNEVFKFDNIVIKKDFISWTTIGEESGGKMEVELYEGDKWIKLYSESNKGGLTDNIYEAKTYHHSGENKYRICYTTPDGEQICSHEYFYRSSQPPASFYPAKVEDLIYFHAEYPVFYQIYDKKGNLILEGRGKTADCTGLEKGKYILYFDNQQETFKKK